MIQAVAGFLFSMDRKRVALIRKNKPEFHNGMLNAIGGKLEPGEMFMEAMSREFYEETGVLFLKWEYFLELNVPNWLVKFYRAFSDDIDKVKTTTDEAVDIYKVNYLSDYLIVPNLRWLVPMALCSNVAQARVDERNNV